jgi:predicted O-methyltransferase YrrM
MLPPLHDPTSIYRLRDCLAAADCLGAAIVHLDLFGELARQPGTVDELCGRLGIHRRPTMALLTLCAAHGLVERDAAGIHRPTGTAREFLVADAPRDARAYYASMADRPGVTDFMRVLRTGQPAGWPGEEGEADWHAAMRTDAFAASFTAAMDCRGRVLAPPLAEVLAAAGGSPPRLLDVGGGSGVYSIATVARITGSRGTVFEAQPVDRIARNTIAQAGLAERIDVLTGDMFTAPWPTDHDLHLFSNVLHDWDEAVCRRLLERSTSALPPGGRIAIHDMFLDDDLAGPVWAAEYSVLLATVTQGRLYARCEVGRWLADLGFSIEREAPTALGRGVIVAGRGG